MDAVDAVAGGDRSAAFPARMAPGQARSADSLLPAEQGAKEEQS